MNYLTDENIRQFIQSALKEDIGDGDHSSLASIPADAQRKARLLIKGEGVLAGVELAKHIFAEVDPELKLDIQIEDGTVVKYGEIGLYVEGKAQSILTGERLVLNCMQRMSGIATYTRKLTDMISHTNAKLLDTRKTTPNARIIEKWAVKIGGGTNHRFGLYDMVMLKDNHVDYCGGIDKAINKTVDYLNTNNLDLKIVVEVRDLNELQQCIDNGKIYRALLDNMSPEMMTEAVKMVGDKFLTEASGGINETNIVAAAETGVDFISIGALTHSYKSLDISLKAMK